MPTGSLALFRNTALPGTAVQGMTSTVGEPSVANRGDQIFFTGNWYASQSSDNGASWQFVNPFSFLPQPAGRFCCDQTAIHIPSRDATVWLLQYSRANNTNVLRIAVNVGDLGVNDWHWWDLSPVQVNPQWAGEWFDYNHAAISDNFLYVVSNSFTVAGDDWRRCVVFRIPLDLVAGGGTLRFNHFQSTTNFSLRCTQGARNVMYFASHNGNQQIRLFSWPESSTQVSQVNVAVTPWLSGAYSAPGPDNTNWLARCDPRITGAWVANGVIGFMWTANRMGSRPFPHVRVVRVNEATKTRRDEPDLWSSNNAYAYPDACPNGQGEVGITLFRGGGALHPGHAVGLWDDAANRWSLLATKNGTHGPSDNKWGDYLTCRRHAPDGRTWLAAGFTLQGGGTRDRIEPRVVHFGREEEEEGEET